MYEKFIEQDDDNIMKVIRRIFIIYSFKLRDMKTSFLFKWRTNCIQNNTIEIASRADTLITSDNIRGLRKPSPKKKAEIPKQKKKTANKEIELQYEPIPPKKEPEVSHYETIIHDISEIKEEKPDFVVVKTGEQFTLPPKKDRLCDRLHKDKEIRELKQSNLVKKYKTREIAECTFAPKIINRSVSQDGDPAYIKLFEYSKEKDSRKRILSHDKEIEFDKVYTFTPTVNKNDKFVTESFEERMKK
jgi:hypothetical protein